jgi:hypothetical protein
VSDNDIGCICDIWKIRECPDDFDVEKFLEFLDCITYQPKTKPEQPNQEQNQGGLNDHS